MIVSFKRKCVKDNRLLMIISTKNSLMVILLEVHGIPHSGCISSVWPAQQVRENFHTRTTMYGPSQLGWNFPSVGLAVFSKTLLKTKSPASNVCVFTCRLCKLANLCWYDAMHIAAASRSSLTVSRSVIMALVFASS